MRPPFLPADLQRDMGMLLEEGSLDHETSDVNKKVDSSIQQGRQTASYFTSYCSPQGSAHNLSQSRQFSGTSSPGPSRQRGGEPLWDYSPDESAGAREVISPATYDASADFRFPARLSESPEGPQTSEASLSSAIAAISFMAAAATGGSPFPSFDAISGGDGEGDFRVTVPGSATTVTGSPSKPTFSAASDSTAASPDLDVNALLRILAPSATSGPGPGRAPHLQYGESGVCRSMQQFLSTAAPGSSSELTASSGTFQEGGDSNSASQGLSIPLFGMHASRFLAQRTERQPPHFQFASEAVLCASHNCSQEDTIVDNDLAPASTLSCAELGRLTTKYDLVDERSDTVEVLDSFLQHTLGSSKRKNYPLQSSSSHFQSPSSGTFLNKPYGPLDAQDALKKLLDCFGTLPEQHGLAAPAAAAAAVLREHQVKHADGQRRRSPLPSQRPSSTMNSLTLSVESAEHRVPWLHLSPTPPSISSQGSLSPSNRSGLTLIGSRYQGASTAPAAMVTDSEGMLAALLSSWRATECSEENPPAAQPPTTSDSQLHSDGQPVATLSSNHVALMDHREEQSVLPPPLKDRELSTWTITSPADDVTQSLLSMQSLQSTGGCYGDCNKTATQGDTNGLTNAASNEVERQHTRHPSSAGSPSSSGSRQVSGTVRDQTQTRTTTNHHEVWSQNDYCPPPLQRPIHFDYFSNETGPADNKQYDIGYASDRFYEFFRARGGQQLGMGNYDLPFYDNGGQSEFQRQSARIGDSYHSGNRVGGLHYPYDRRPLHPTEGIYDGFNRDGISTRPLTDGGGKVQRLYSDDRDRMVYVSWIPKKARAFNTIDKRRMELELKRKLREDLGLGKLTKVLLFPPKGVHCKLIFDSRFSAANFMSSYGGDNRSIETEKWKTDLCGIYNIDMQEKFDKTVVKIEWSQK